MIRRARWMIGGALIGVCLVLLVRSARDTLFLERCYVALSVPGPDLSRPGVTHRG